MKQRCKFWGLMYHIRHFSVWFKMTVLEFTVRLELRCTVEFWPALLGHISKGGWTGYINHFWDFEDVQRTVTMSSYSVVILLRLWTKKHWWLLVFQHQHLEENLNVSARYPLSLTFTPNQAWLCEVPYFTGITASISYATDSASKRLSPNYKIMPLLLKSPIPHTPDHGEGIWCVHGISTSMELCPFPQYTR